MKRTEVANPFETISTSEGPGKDAKGFSVPLPTYDLLQRMEQKWQHLLLM